MNILGTNITAPVVPFSTEDIFASHIDLYGKGGYRCLDNLDSRDSIVELRRSNLMLVSVENNSYISEGTNAGYAIYQLILNNESNVLSDGNIMNNNNWVEFEVNGSGSDSWILPAPPSSSSQGIKGQKSFDNDFFYICIEDNLWKRIAMDYFIWNESATSGFDSTSTFSLEYGAMPKWDGQDWSYDIVVDYIQAINSYGEDGTSLLLSGLLIKYTDGTEDIIDNISGESGNNWVLPAPPTSLSNGNKGDRSYSDGFFYVCVEDNIWKRINLDFFDSFETGSTAGYLWDLDNGVVPIWDNGWTYDTVVKNLTYTNGYLNVNYTNSSENLNLNKSLNNLTDVEIINPKNKDVIAYNGTSWYNTTLDILASTSGETTYTTINSLRDVSIINPQDDDILLLNGTTWYNYNINEILSKDVYSSVDTLTILGTGANSIADVSLYSTSGIGSNIIKSVQINKGNIFKSTICGYYNVTNDTDLTFSIKVKYGDDILYSSSDITINGNKTNLLFDIMFSVSFKSVGASAHIIGQGRVYLSLDSVSTPVMAQLVRVSDLITSTNTDKKLDCLITVNNDFIGNINVTTACIEK